MKYNDIVNFPFERATVTHPWVFWDNWFTNIELQKIIEYCQSAPIAEAKTVGGEKNYRVSQIKWIFPKEDNLWFFEKMNRHLEMVNNRWYGFDLNGYPSFQYTEYHAEEKGHYDWHMDLHPGLKEGPVESDFIQPRKLSLSIMLNDDYEGGDLQFNIRGEDAPQTPEKKVGRIITFPSFILHRVTPVISGIRKSIVVWVMGAKFT